MRICWVGTFEPEFSRNRKLARLLELLEADVTIIRVRVWDSDRIGLARSGKLRALLRSLVGYPLLMWRMVRTPTPDLYLVSYPGWFDVPFVTLTARLLRRPMVFDPFISLHDTMIADRAMFHPRSLEARAASWIDRLSLRLADTVIADTPAHLALYDRLAPGTAAKGGVVALGADDQVFAPRQADVDDRLVFFHGSFVPLQGLDTIVQAALLLKSDGFRFRIVGDGQIRGDIERLAKEIGATNVEFVGAVPLEDLPDMIAGAGICLGIFGTSAKAGRVIPHKLYECLAVGRPVITRRSDALEEMFAPEEVAAIPAGDPQALADTIRRLSGDPAQRETLAEAGATAYRTRFHETILSASLEKVLSDVALETHD